MELTFEFLLIEMFSVGSEMLKTTFPPCADNLTTVTAKKPDWDLIWLVLSVHNSIWFPVMLIFMQLFLEPDI